MADKVAATLTVNKAAEMTKRGRGYLADWLEHCARTIRRDGGKFSRLFTAQYRYTISPDRKATKAS